MGNTTLAGSVPRLQPNEPGDSYPAPRNWVKIVKMIRPAAGSDKPREPRRTGRVIEPSARERRVAEIRAQVENGTYKIDSLELSKKIVQKHIVP